MRLPTFPFGIGQRGQELIGSRVDGGDKKTP
jgi:hypothetical protein